MMKKATMIVAAMIANPPKTPPTMAPIGALLPPAAGALLAVSDEDELGGLELEVGANIDGSPGSGEVKLPPSIKRLVRGNGVVWPFPW
jgi:hypothetical protein